MARSSRKIPINQKQFLKQAVNRIIKGFKPNRILLFGSHAYGRPGLDSDLDILVIKNTRLTPPERARQVSRIIGSHVFPLDLIVLTPSEIHRRLSGFDPFLEEALRQGKVLYDKNR